MTVLHISIATSSLIKRNLPEDSRQQPCDLTPIRRRDAKRAGLRHYFTGKPCSRGHIGPRLVSTFQCLRCCAEWSHKARVRDPELARARVRAWDKRNRAIVSERARQWRINNPEKAREKDRKSRLRRAEKVAVSQKAYREANRERMRAKDRERRLANPEKHIQQSRACYRRHAEKRRAEAKAFRKANPERFKEWSKAWLARNPDKKRAYSSKRKAQLRRSNGAHTAADIADIKLQQKFRCGYCRVKLGRKYHVDHIVALSRGGTNDRRNLQILCQPCNQQKYAKDPIEFAREIGRLL